MNSNQPNKEEELPEPWYWTDIDLNAELASETSANHILYGKKVVTLARGNNDDVLYKVLDSEFEFAVVHLTWSTNKHEDGRWPTTKTYTDWEDVYENRIIIDHQEYQ